jgi:hypothetical protein
LAAVLSKPRKFIAIAFVLAHGGFAASIGHAAPLSTQERAPTEAANTVGATIRFRYEQARYMRRRHGPGATAYVAPGVASGVPVPVVVFLHGLNASERVAPHLDGATDDLRPVVDALMRDGAVEPFVLAAPTHARIATGTKVMWHDFALDEFLNETQLALGTTATLDRARVVLIAYSGGACNLSGGFLGAAANSAVGLIAIDPCSDAESQERLREIAMRIPVSFYHQREWHRDLSLLQSAHPSGLLDVREFRGFASNPHAAILPIAFVTALRHQLPRAVTLDAELE